jgi:flagellum-specific peptidoglycan hydrolase FlgJ
MKNVMTILGAILFATTILTSCGGGEKKPNEINLKPISSSIKGELSEYFNIVEGTYKLTGDDKYSGTDNYQLKVQFSRTDKAFDFDVNSVLNIVGGFALYCDLLDEQTAPVIQADRGGMITQGSSDGIESLASLKSGETGWVTYHFSGSPEVIEKIKSFSVDSKSGKDLQRVSSSTSSESTDNSSSTSSVDCDQFIKDYSAFADSYVKLMKKYKANQSDPSILNEYTEAAQKAMDMQKDDSSCTDPAYASKLMELANQIAKAAM